MISFLTSPLLKWGAAALAVAGLILGALWYLDSERAQARKDGAAEVTNQVKSNTIIIQREIKRAEDTGPRTSRDVSKRLRDGTF